MASGRSSKSSGPSKLRLARGGIRALLMARRLRSNVRSRRRGKEEPDRRRASRKVVALSLGLVALGLAAVGLYLMRDRIPGPWRKPGAPTEGGDQAAEAAADAEPKSDDGPTPEIAVV